MRIFVYEYVCAGGSVEEPLSASLRAEGWAMLAAVLEDFSRCRDVQVFTLLKERLDVGSHPPENVRVRAARSGEEEDAFRELARAADWSLVIAPEFDDLLAERCRWVEEVGGRLLGPSAAAVRATGDKLRLARQLLDLGIATPRCCLLPEVAVSFPAVCKPRQGAGSQATFLVRDERELSKCLDRARAEGWRGEMILQPFVPGTPVSVAFLLGGDEGIALPPATQELTNDGRFRYRGGRVPIAPELARRAQELGERAVRAVVGLRGYVGVDLVLGEAADAVIEINPRLTTSYVGLRALADFNLAEAILAAATGGVLPLMRWKARTVSFKPAVAGREY
jgi:predicted ATP-grasp superfamily ATP-dependent carboligase